MTAVILVSLTTTTELAAIPPILTEVIPVKLVPVNVTAMPPATLLLAGLMLVKVGAFAS